MSDFFGSHAINMDAKGRLAIPAKLRDALAELCDGRIVLTANADEEQCLLLYPEPEWEVLHPKIQALPTMSRAVRRLQRLVLGNAAKMELDSSGRILVPPTLRQHAHLEKKVMLIGLGKKMELWNEERWFAWTEASSDEDEMPPEMKALSL